MLHWWVWAGWTDGYGAAGIAGGLCMNEFHCTYHVFCIFLCLLFYGTQMLSLAHVYINFSTAHSKVVT